MSSFQLLMPKSGLPCFQFRPRPLRRYFKLASEPELFVPQQWRLAKKPQKHPFGCQGPWIGFCAKMPGREPSWAKFPWVSVALIKNKKRKQKPWESPVDEFWGGVCWHLGEAAGPEMEQWGYSWDCSSTQANVHQDLIHTSHFNWQKSHNGWVCLRERFGCAELLLQKTSGIE